MILLQFIHQLICQFNNSFEVFSLSIVFSTESASKQRCLPYLLHLLFRLQEAFNQMELLLIVLKYLIRTVDQIVDALSADPFLSGNLAQRKIFTDRCFINILLVIGQQLAVKIKEQRSTQNIVHAAHYIDAFYMCQVFFLDSLNDDHGIPEREETIALFHCFLISL